MDCILYSKTNSYTVIRITHKTALCLPLSLSRSLLWALLTAGGHGAEDGDSPAGGREPGVDPTTRRHQVQTPLSSRHQEPRGPPGHQPGPGPSHVLGSQLQQKDPAHSRWVRCRGEAWGYSHYMFIHCILIWCSPLDFLKGYIFQGLVYYLYICF